MEIYLKINTQGLHFKKGDKLFGYNSYNVDIYDNGSFLLKYNCQYKKSQEVCENLVLQDPIKKITYKAAKLKEPRDRYKSVLLPDNNILIIGGEQYDHVELKYIPSPLVELYNPSTGKTKIIGKMSYPRTNPNVIILKNCIVIITGSDEYNNPGYDFIIAISLRSIFVASPSSM